MKHTKGYEKMRQSLGVKKAEAKPGSLISAMHKKMACKKSHKHTKSC